MNRVLSNVSRSVTTVRAASQITKVPAPSSVTQKNAKFDEITHTGQAWDQADYRLQRFDTAPKQVVAQLKRTTLGDLGTEVRPTPNLPCINEEEMYSYPRLFGVNPNVAMNLVAERAAKDCGGEHVVHCDGGHAGLGHPRVYINLDKPGAHACGYCGNRFYNSHVTKGEDLNIQHLNC